NIFSVFFTAIPLLLSAALYVVRLRIIKTEEAKLKKNRENELNRQLSVLDERIVQNRSQHQKLLARLEGLQAMVKPEDTAGLKSEMDRAYRDIENDRQRAESDLTQSEKELLADLLQESDDSLMIKAAGLKKNIVWQLQKSEAEYAVISETVKSGGSRVSISDIDNEINRLTRQKMSLDQKGEALNIAINTLETAAEQVRKKYVPLMNKVLNNTFSGLTAEKYSDVRTGENLKIMLEDPSAHTLIPVSMLSDGTIDQIYFALRVAISETVLNSHESLPFIMDEPFAQYDDERTCNALKYIANLSKKQQIIIFTCKKREVELISGHYPCKICSLT
ncbi:MAG TPA: hypothetical protein VHP38_09790, partial [Ruminiclostridium sp.]|nr:hypothetical protein [Ruminiclostridium sp.]